MFVEYAPLLAALDIVLVDIDRNDHGRTSVVGVTIMKHDGGVGIDDCAKVYNLVYPRLALELGSRDVHLEVSTPGLQRNLKDVYEFSLYRGKRVRIYESEHSRWISGIIADVGEDAVSLATVSIGDAGTVEKAMTVPFTEIQKAKLDYRWEDDVHGN